MFYTVILASGNRDRQTKISVANFVWMRNNFLIQLLPVATSSNALMVGTVVKVKCTCMMLA
jgi:hypothetical protein